MSGLGRLWAGRIYGTNTGNVSVTLDVVDKAVTGELRLADEQYGPAIYALTGEYENGTIKLAGEPKQAPPGIELGKLEILGSLEPEGSIKGEWKSDVGTGGIFHIFPHSRTAPSGRATVSLEQINEEQREFRAIRIYGSQLEALVDVLTADFAAKPRVVTTYRTDAGVKTVYLEDFLGLLQAGTKVVYLKLFAQEPEANGINKTVMLELTNGGINLVRAQSTSQAWALGKVEAISRQIASYEQKFASSYRKHGIGAVQALILGGLLVTLPSLEAIWQRVALFLAVLAVLWLFGIFHMKVLTNFTFFAGERVPSVWDRAWPSLVSWLSGILAAIVAAYAAFLLGVT